MAHPTVAVISFQIGVKAESSLAIALPGALGSDLVDAASTGIPDRLGFIRKILETFVTSDDAKEVLETGFDAEGVTRLFEGWGSFRKVYTPSRAMAASRSLLGWLYEASEFNKTVLKEAATEVAGSWAAVLDALGVRVKNVAYHFNVTIAGQQATDHLADLTLTFGNRSVRVIGVGMEQKAESDILAGVRQVARIPKRFAAGQLMVSENGPFVIGKDMYVDLGDALAELLNNRRTMSRPSLRD